MFKKKGKLINPGKVILPTGHPKRPEEHEVDTRRTKLKDKDIVKSIDFEMQKRPYLMKSYSTHRACHCGLRAAIP